MTKEQFNIFWASTFPDTLPISHYFKYDYSDRWFRIHSLPESKRYADNEDEWTILLNRQNTIISDLLGEGNPILLVTGNYIEKETTSHILEETEVLKPYNFISLDEIDFHKIDPANNELNQVYKPALAETVWQSGRHDTLLQAIANDELRAFFISVERTVIVAPYDGGMDFILKDTQTRNSYKIKYKDWLSKRQDGF